MQPTLGFIGAGKVGSVLARLWYGAGYKVTAIYSRDTTRAAGLADAVNATQVSSFHDVIRQADLTLLTVADDAISQVVGALTDEDWAGKAVLHTSGVYDVQVLKPLSSHGAMTGSLHPAFPFASVDESIRAFENVTFALEGDYEVLRHWLRDMITALDGRVLELPPGGKAAYHAALVIASNYTVTLYAAAERMLLDLGADRAVADQALNTLVGATMENLRVKGVPWALTGPLARADEATIAAHLAALEDDLLLDMYCGLARLTYPLLRERGLSDDVIARIEQVLASG